MTTIQKNRVDLMCTQHTLLINVADIYASLWKRENIIWKRYKR